MTQSKPWRKRYLRQISKYIDISSGVMIDPRFQKDVEGMRSLGEKLDSVSGLRTWHKEHKPTLLMQKYRLAESLYDFVYHYVKTGEMREELIGSGVVMVSEIDFTAIDGAVGNAWNRYFRNKIMVDDFDQVSSELKIVLSPDIYPTNVTDFLKDKEVQAFILEKRKLQGSAARAGKIKESSSRIRDLLVFHLKGLGLPNEQVADMVEEEYGGIRLTGNEVTKIYTRINTELAS